MSRYKNKPVFSDLKPKTGNKQIRAAHPFRRDPIDILSKLSSGEETVTAGPVGAFLGPWGELLNALTTFSSPRNNPRRTRP